jgi:hypothetical protein
MSVLTSVFKGFLTFRGLESVGLEGQAWWGAKGDLFR